MTRGTKILLSLMIITSIVYAGALFLWTAGLIIIQIMGLNW